MRVTPTEIGQIEPELISTEYGKWLAVTESQSNFRIAVVGDTEEDARQRFAAARDAWSAAVKNGGHASEVAHSA